MPGGLIPSALGAVAKEGGVLRALYDDVGAPGARQVGKALGTVLETGNIILLPLRMLNQAVAEHERRTFDQVARRFETIPDERIIDVRPEIGVPLLERLSITRDDDLRKLYIELLSSAADSTRVNSAHPSFVKVIESLSPDEAKLLMVWKSTVMIPCLSLLRAGEEKGSASVIHDVLLDSPIGERSADTISAYVSNMVGLGLISHEPDAYLTAPNVYDGMIAELKKQVPNIKDKAISYQVAPGQNIAPGDLLYNKGHLRILAYGRLFQSCCVPSPEANDAGEAT